MKGLRLALGTLTIIPVGPIGTIERRDARAAMLLAPLAALPLALVVSAVLAIGRLCHAPALVSGLAAVAALAYGTRAMHLDGLADTVDGFGAGWSRERALEVMKTGDVGPMGVVALLVALGTQATCFGVLTHAPLTAGIAVMFARLGCTMMASTRWRPARSDGLGATMAGTVGPGPLLGTAIASAAVLMAAAALEDIPVIRGIASFALAVCGWEWLGRRATRVIGGVTGDIFGAAVEITLTLILIPLACGGTP